MGDLPKVQRVNKDSPVLLLQLSAPLCSALLALSDHEIKYLRMLKKFIL